VQQIDSASTRNLFSSAYANIRVVNKQQLKNHFKIARHGKKTSTIKIPRHGKKNNFKRKNIGKLIKGL